MGPIFLARPSARFHYGKIEPSLSSVETGLALPNGWRRIWPVFSLL